MLYRFFLYFLVICYLSIIHWINLILICTILIFIFVIILHISGCLTDDTLKHPIKPTHSKIASLILLLIPLRTSWILFITGFIIWNLILLFINNFKFRIVLRVITLRLGLIRCIIQCFWLWWWALIWLRLFAFNL